MSTLDLSTFDFSFDPTLDTWAAQEPDEQDSSEIFLPNTEGTSEFLPPDPDKIPVIEASVNQDDPSYAARPAEERTRELFGQMRPHRATMLGILEAAREPLSTAAVRKALESSGRTKFSVYTPSNFCTMLEVAGALERVTAEGAPYGEARPEPAIVVVDGQEFYEPTEPPIVCWKTTEAGSTIVAEDDPAERIARLFEREPEYLPVYKRVLLMGQNPEGTSMGLMSVAVDTDPFVAENRRFYVQHFVESLERAGAFAWEDKAWRTTEAGAAALDGALAAVVDSYEIPALEDVVEMPTTTDGVRW
ncbi:hypothetical protein [uncultured Adlercreutzia sp.]|uniref:hypothetical protein n=1 Tax=uncultured Adlercreutzia sp. TaxID=875803 RepID=UPI0025D34184|nr:hypothetical protein [uncultured Adlercreutzia sp.]MCI9261479.1 hypothetical protein [Eggerthellaceae bacterium]